MKKILTIFVMSAFIYLIPGRNGPFCQTPLNFQGSFFYNPILPHGDIDTWEAAIFLPYVFVHEGTFYIFYSGLNTNWTTGIGFATSTDGYSFTKYSGNPVFTPSLNGFDSYNPVLKVGDQGNWDDKEVWLCNVQKNGVDYQMYYTGSQGSETAIGYAYSSDGIFWTKHASNPVYTINDDPYAVAMGYPPIVEQPAIVYDYDNNTAFMYYDYGITYPGEISIATAELPIGVRESTKYNFRSTNFPNPVNQSTTFSYALKETGPVTIQIYNSFRQMVAEPLNANQPKGEQKVTWDAATLPAGIYFYRIRAGMEVDEGKIMVVK